MIIIHFVVDYQRKAGATLAGSDVRGLQAMAQSAGKRWLRGIVLYTGNEVIPFGPNLHGVPLPFLWGALK